MGEVNVYCDDCRRSTTGRCAAHVTYTMPAGATISTSEPMPWGPDALVRCGGISQAQYDDVRRQLFEAIARESKLVDENREIAATVARHEATIAQLTSAVAEAKQELEDRKIVERAKGVLMRQHGLTEQEAYTWIRKRSQDQGQRMRVVADAVLVVHGAPGKRGRVELAPILDRGDVPAASGVEGEDEAADESDSAYAED